MSFGCWLNVAKKNLFQYFERNVVFVAAIMMHIYHVTQISVWVNIISFHSFPEISFDSKTDVSIHVL